MKVFVGCLLAVLIGVASADVFEFPEYDLLPFWWMNKNNFIPENRASCTTATSEGTCMLSHECLLARGDGRRRGNCTYFNTCCTFEKKCNQNTNARVSYFVGTDTTRKAGSCSMRVNLANENVCQMRIDITDLTLQGVDGTDVAAGNPAVAAPIPHNCVNDKFTVTQDDGENGEPFTICGTTRDNHFYVHLNPTRRTKGGINLAIKWTASDLTPSWNVKVTQLECAGDRRLSFDSKWQNPLQAVHDKDSLAPAGCFQYFTEPTGTFKSFGYETPTSNGLSSGQDYASCFKRNGNCAQYTFINPPQLGFADAACTEAYIYIPEDSTDKNRYCTPVAGATLPLPTISTDHPGPLYAHVHIASSYTNPLNTQSGFGINYNSASRCV